MVLLTCPAPILNLGLAHRCCCARVCRTLDRCRSSIHVFFTINPVGLLPCRSGGVHPSFHPSIHPTASTFPFKRSLIPSSFYDCFCGWVYVLPAKCTKCDKCMFKYTCACAWVRSTLIFHYGPLFPLVSVTRNRFFFIAKCEVMRRM